MRQSPVILLVVVLLISFYGCKKNSSTKMDYKMTGSVNGAAFDGTNTLAMTGPDSILNIYGGFFSGNAISAPYIFLNICPYRGVGTYVIPTPPWGSVTRNYASIDSSNYYSMNGVSAYGTIIITASSPDIVGSFNFTTVDSAKVYGTFAVKAP